MNDASATAREAPEARESSLVAETCEDRASREMSVERTTRRRQVIRDLLLDSLTGSRPYVKSYRAGRGAE